MIQRLHYLYLFFWCDCVGGFWFWREGGESGLHLSIINLHVVVLSAMLLFVTHRSWKHFLDFIFGMDFVYI